MESKGSRIRRQIRYGRPTAQRFFYLGPVPLFPAFNFFFIPLQCASLGFLRGPFQAVHPATYVGTVISDSELPLDDLSNADRGPEIRAVAMGHRSLSRKRTKRFRCVAVSFQGRPGEKRTRNAFAPPRRRALRHRITELALHPMRRPTSLRKSRPHPAGPVLACVDLPTDRRSPSVWA